MRIGKGGTSTAERTLKMIGEHPGIRADQVFLALYRGRLDRMSDEQQEAGWERFVALLLHMAGKGRIVSGRLSDGGGWRVRT